jgi:hypothetical protein
MHDRLVAETGDRSPGGGPFLISKGWIRNILFSKTPAKLFSCVFMRFGEKWIYETV